MLLLQRQQAHVPELVLHNLLAVEDERHCSEQNENTEHKQGQQHVEEHIPEAEHALVAALILALLVLEGLLEIPERLVGKLE